MKKVPVYYNENEKITDKELKRLFAIAKENNKHPDDLLLIANSLGYRSRKEIKRSDLFKIEQRLIND